MQIYADFKQKGGGVEGGSREEALVEVPLQIHWLFTYIYIFLEYICLKKSAGMSDLKLKDIKSHAYKIKSFT